MRAVMVMYDTLNRRFLEPYGCDWVKTPNFTRLAERAVTMDTSYAGSLPTIPARRELHTGRYQFLHRGWGPIEPFDDSVPAILAANGIYTHLASDGYHYWEHGGMTYHNMYSSWEFSRGQENDHWKGEVAEPEIPEGSRNRHYWVNRKYMQREEDTSQGRTFGWGLEFIERNHTEDNWFLQIETFDPHEPYFVPQKYLDLYPHDYDGPDFDWPGYARTDGNPGKLQHMRYRHAALTSMCDASLGKVLDAFDTYDLWKDTMLIVNTDHGFLLGEHGWTGKCRMPFYNEIAHTPLFVWDPRSGVKGLHRKALVQTIDLGPTLLDFFGQPLTDDMQGKPLINVVAEDKPIRDAALFGLFGAHVNSTDGRYVYMRGPAKEENTPLFNYTLMPTHMRNFFHIETELHHIELADPFSFTKGCKIMKIKNPAWSGWHEFGNQLFDLKNDPGQEHPIEDAEIEKTMSEHMVRLMKKNDAPPEQFERLGLAR